MTTTLANGLRVITDPMDTVETASLGVWIESGTRHEESPINGISHLLEHMAFKGTRRRTARGIAEEIEAVGGHLNAYTSREHTAYFAKVLKEDLGLAVDIISDILLNSVIDAEELAREQAVIIQEINLANDTPDDIVFERFQETAFPGQALGRPVMGSTDLVAGMTRQMVIDYMGEHYTGSRMILSAAGRVDHDDMVAMAEAAFAGLSSGAGGEVEQARFVGGDYREERDLEQVHMLLGFQGVAYEDPDFYPASVFSTLFGGGMSSRLFQEVREKRGLAYSVYSFLSCYTDGGLLGIYAGTGEREVEEAVPLICDEIVKVRQQVSEDEVARARAQLKAGILMSMESTSARCEHLARQLMVFRRPIPAAEIIANIEAVDVDAVRRAARRIASGPTAFAAIGPIGRVQGIEAIGERLRQDRRPGTENGEEEKSQ